MARAVFESSFLEVEVYLSGCNQRLFALLIIFFGLTLDEHPENPENPLQKSEVMCNEDIADIKKVLLANNLMIQLFSYSVNQLHRVDRWVNFNAVI